MKTTKTLERSVFHPEPLDWRDRKILELICKYGRKGQSFNKLAEEAKPFASRSTFALRIEKLQRLNYMEKLRDEKNKQVKWIRGTLQARMLMWLVERVREDAAEIERFIAEKEEELSKKTGELSPQEVEEFKGLLKEIMERIEGTFSSIAVIAVTYGETAAGDIFLPSVMESFKNVMLKLISLIKTRPALAEAAFFPKEKPPEEILKEAGAFFNEFGEEILERLPAHLQSKKAIIKEMMAHPEKLRSLQSLLWIQQQK